MATPDPNTMGTEPPPCPSAAAPIPDGRQHDHGQHHHKVLHDQKTKRDLAVQAVNLTLVGQQFHDDDGGRECQRNGDIQAGDMPQPKRKPDQVAENRREGDLPQTCQQGHPPQAIGSVLTSSFDPDKEQQHRDSQLRQQPDLGIRAHKVQRGWSRDQPHGYETDNQGADAG